MQGIFTELESGDHPYHIPFYTSNNLEEQKLKDTFWKESLRNPNNQKDIPKAGTSEWFMMAEKLRYSHYGKWVPKLLEFNKHAGEKILGIGSGLGTDWAQYAINGAEVWATSTKETNDELIKRNFRIRNLNLNIRKISKQGIPFANSSFDVILLNDFCREELTLESLCAEIQRILKPGGKLLSISQSFYNINFFIRNIFQVPEVKNNHDIFFTAGELKSLFAFCQETRVHKRHLQRTDLPPLCRWIPTPIIERLLGKHLIFKGFKPLSLPIPVLQAA